MLAGSLAPGNGARAQETYSPGHLSLGWNSKPAHISGHTSRLPRQAPSAKRGARRLLSEGDTADAARRTASSPRESAASSQDHRATRGEAARLLEPTTKRWHVRMKAVNGIDARRSGVRTSVIVSYSGFAHPGSPRSNRAASTKAWAHRFFGHR